MSERQIELDEVVDALGELREGDTVTLVTDGGSITATVTSTRWHSDGAVITFDDHDAARNVRVHTERYSGWLDPLVDAYTSDDPDLHRPIGLLVDVRLVAAADDQPRQRGRP